MSFSRLATVEVQLIMHHCDTADLLNLACCSRHTLAAASAKYAWNDAVTPMHALVSPARWQPHAVLPLDLHALRDRSPLLRHSPISVHSSEVEGDGQHWQNRWTVLAALRDLQHCNVRTLSVHKQPRLPHHPHGQIAALDARESILTSPQWQELLCSPALKGLTSLSTSDWSVVDASMGHRLRSSLPQPLLSCYLLRRLTLLEPASSSSGLNNTLTHQNFAGLEELDLSSAFFYLGWPKVFANLQRLRSLTLRSRWLNDESLQEIVDALTDHYALRLLELDLRRAFSHWNLPSAELLLAALTNHANPQRKVTLLAPPTGGLRPWRKLAQRQPRFTLIETPQPSERMSGCCVQ